MKKLMLFVFCVLSYYTISAQNENTNPYLKENVFYVTIESGGGEQISISFTLKSDAIEKIINSKIYKEWENVTFSDPKNAGFIEKYKTMPHIDIFLMGEIRMAAFYAKMKIKNSTSFLPVKGNGGFIYVGEGDKINISFPFQAQNGYGNMIFSKAYYSIIWDETKNEKTTNCFIS
jgi:hypothetical protein